MLKINFLSKNITNEKRWDYFILVARFLLAWTFFRYGYSKLTGGQFGLKPEELLTPLQDLNLFRVSWYLFDHQPFKAFVGVSQIVCGALLLINRTAIIGAFLFLPIVTAVLVIDISFMPPGLMRGFIWRLTIYIIFDLLILYHYKERMLIVSRTIIQGITTKFKFPIWSYLILPIMAILLEFVLFIPKAIYEYIFH
ncbi:DoxX family membrane protein [Winogradskyella flava]|uniref:DoxX family membrane protein n=1 Tax=Winogradskyella flava TaxID=1884876 RepID=UPI002491902B|nr:DoxX family membrane protein [Winogradskyella flava]